MSARRGGLAVAAAVAITSCMPAARVFLDIPEGRPGGRESEAGTITMEALDSALARLEAPPEPPRPPIEAVTSLDSTLALLPADRAGHIDWVMAWRDGTIQPRPQAPAWASDSTGTGGFGFDFYLQSGAGPEAYFPHSVHQEWLSCASCHPRVYRNGRAGGVSAAVTHDEGSCASCHGAVAFPMQACERCHQDATGLPRGRANKDLGRVLSMKREGSDGDEVEGSDLYEPARFPHGEHRLRFQCRACHEQPFAMKSGGTVLGREKAHSVEGCGSCHDGNTAFATNMDACYRCHLENGA